MRNVSHIRVAVSRKSPLTYVRINNVWLFLLLVKGMLESAVDHLIYNTLPSATDYSAAEEALTSAYERCPQLGSGGEACKTQGSRAGDRNRWTC